MPSTAAVAHIATPAGRADGMGSEPRSAPLALAKQSFRMEGLQPFGFGYGHQLEGYLLLPTKIQRMF